MKFFQLLLLAFAVGLVVSQSLNCPNGCSNQGHCNADSTCTCNAKYEGDDCSIYDEHIRVGQTASGSVEMQQWKYFNVDTDAGDSLTWWLNRTSQTGDCDLYIQFGVLPSRSNFLARNISTLPELRVVIDNTKIGTYFAGVYGYKGCSFNIAAEVGTACPENCNGHGTCNAEDGTCECDLNHAGEFCEIDVVSETVEHVYEGTVGFQEWVYYSYHTPSDVVSELDWIMTKTGTGPHEDCDMYLKEHSLPTLWDWDFCNVSTATTSIIVQSEVHTHAHYYLGIYGYQGCSFQTHIHSISPVDPSDCPNKCSGHSSACHSDRCTCNSGYSGMDCETYNDPITLGTTYSGYAGENAWNYYQVNGDVGGALLISLLRVSEGDVDLYVKGGQKPSRYNYDYLDISTQERMTLTIDTPAGETWWIGIYGFHAATYNLVVQVTEKCGCVDSQHGSCGAGSAICVCKPGFAGDDCSMTVTPLRSGVPLYNETISNHEWKYYSVESTGTSAASISVKEHTTSGLVWLFVNHEEAPSLVDYDYSDKSHHDAIHQVSFSVSEEAEGTLWIGVYGSPFIPEVTIDGKGTVVTYDISAWVSDF